MASKRKVGRQGIGASVALTVHVLPAQHRWLLKQRKLTGLSMNHIIRTLLSERLGGKRV